MYRLNVIIGNESYIGRYFNEEDLIEAMVQIANKFNIYAFNIIEVLDNIPYHYRTIHNEEEFKEMLNTYKITKNIEDESALKLKDYITRRILKRKL